MRATDGDEPEVLGAIRSARRRRVDSFHLGRRLRELRRERGLTLEDAGRQTGLAASTLSKIENDQMSPTFDVVQKLASGFDIDITDLFATNSAQDGTGRRSVTMAGAGRLMETEVYRHRLLAAELKNKKVLPFVTTIKARSLDEFTSWSEHGGEEFVYVLEGEICFHTEHYESVTLGVGDCIYIDSSMQHACYSTSEKDAVVLWVNTG
ncbi:XRE family transcriptional regulator [Sphingomonas sp. HF-S3]|uniref:XRE family transcriptional regulator n=1 Tax=Sphingomonas rustica TaxID=3103142 RepID=A0ABV0BG82_9SPHN